MGECAHNFVQSILTDSTPLNYRQEIIKKLIFDYQITENSDIKSVIKDTKSDWANSMFRTRELHGNLEAELSNNKAVKKSKI